MAKGNEKKEIQFRSYRGPSGIARDSIWMSADDLPEDEDVVLKVVDVLVADDVEFEMEGRHRVDEHVLALKFEGRKRVLKLNNTNRKVMNKLFGRDTAAWFGQTVTLTVAEVMAFGEMIDAVRIRSKMSRSSGRAAKAAESFLSDAPRPAPAPAPPKQAPAELTVFGSIMDLFRLDPAMEPNHFKEEATKAALAFVAKQNLDPAAAEAEVNRLVEQAEKERVA